MTLKEKLHDICEEFLMAISTGSISDEEWNALDEHEKKIIQISIGAANKYIKEANNSKCIQHVWTKVLDSLDSNGVTDTWRCKECGIQQTD